MEALAVVAVAPGQVEVRTIESPEPRPEEVVVRVRRSWISNGTESSYVRGERIAGDTPWRPGDPMPFPHVPGYQKVGVVERVGSEVRDLRPGDVVFAAVGRVEGMFFSYTGHVSPSVCHASNVWKLPDGVDSEAFAGMVLTQVGYNAGTRPEVRPGDRAVVLGDGLVGHWTAQTLQHRGAKVMMLGHRDERLRLFDLHDGDARVNARTEDPVAAARAWAPDGIDVLAHTFGSMDALMALVPALRRYGQIVSAGFLGTEGLIDVQALRAQELTLHTVAGWSRDRMDATLDLIARGVLKTTPLITHRFPVGRAKEAFDLILERKPGVLGVVLEWE